MAEMPVLTQGDLVVATVDDRDEQSTLGSYWSSGVGGFLSTGHTAWLEPFEGVEIAGFPLETDPDAIEDFDDRHGPVDFPDYYRP